MVKRLVNTFLTMRSLIYSAAGLVVAFSLSGETLPTATETAKSMTVGWNLGNSLEAIDSETAWGNPATTQKLINGVKAAGFNTIRIPCSWDIHADQGTGQIKAEWISRVKEVVDYCIKDNLYVIINIHWDKGWLENNCTPDKKDANNAKQKKYWTQIANYFKTYDGRLLFAGANEPNVDDATQMAVLMSYHQTFIDAVRATGGNNSTRVLIVQGPSTDIDKTNKLMSSMPSDPAKDRLMTEIHYYTPWNFCGMKEDASWGKMFYYWGKDNHSKTDTERNPTWGEESEVDKLFNTMKSKFVDKKIPVILGEYGAIKRENLSGEALKLHTASREYYNKYVTKAAIKYGLIPIYWDNGAKDFSIFNRSSGMVSDKGLVKAIMEGAGVNGSTSAINKLSSKSGSYTSPVVYKSSMNDLRLIIDNPEQTKSISIFDQLGKRVKTMNQSAIKKTVSIGQNLNTGVYIVRIDDVTGIHSFRITKN